MAMLEQRPASLDAMGRLPGVGEKKLEKFGHAFLQVLAQFEQDAPPANELSDTVNDTLYLWQKTPDISAVARQRELTETTVYGHLAQAISAGLLQASEVLDLDKASLLEIESAIESLPEAAENRQMKPVFEALDGAYDYGIIRCVMASICP